MFKIAYGPTFLKVEKTSTGSMITLKVKDGEFSRTNAFSKDDVKIEDSKELANGGYLGVFLKNFTPMIGGTSMTPAEKIKTMVAALRTFSEKATTYRTLNNKVRQFFDNNETLPAKEFQSQFFYEGPWRYGKVPRVKKIETAVIKPAKVKKAIIVAVTPAVMPVIAATTPKSKRNKTKTVIATNEPAMTVQTITDNLVEAEKEYEVIL